MQHKGTQPTIHAHSNTAMVHWMPKEQPVTDGTKSDNTAYQEVQ